MAPQAAATQGLYERHAAKIQSYCHHQLGSREEAEDAVQTTFMNAFRALGRGVVPEAESAWLFKIAENVCLSRRRSSWRRGRIESANDFEVIEEIVPGPTRQHDELIGIEDALASMPEQQRRAILLREWQGLSYREVAEELEISQSAVETLIFRARRSLAQGLEQPDSIKPKRKSFRRALHTLDLGATLAALKTLLAGSAAVKATAAAVAVTAAAGTAATVTPKLEGHLPGTQAKPTQKAKPPATAPTGDSSSASGSGSRVTFVDQSGTRSVVLTSSAAGAGGPAASGGERSVKQGVSGPVGAIKAHRRSAPAGRSAGPGVAPVVVDTDMPVAPGAAAPAAGTPTPVAPAVEPVQPTHEPRRPEETKREEARQPETKREESKREEPKREEPTKVAPKSEPRQPVVQPRAEESKKEPATKVETKAQPRVEPRVEPKVETKEASAANGSDAKHGNKDEGKQEESRRGESRREESKKAKEEAKRDEGRRDEGNSTSRGNDNHVEPVQPQAVVASPAVAVATVPESKKTQAAPPPAPAPAPAAAPVTVATTTTTTTTTTTAAPPVAAPAAAPAPASETKEREREKDRDKDRGDGDNGKRKGK